jgi:hypothetical protein
MQNNQNSIDINRQATTRIITEILVEYDRQHQTKDVEEFCSEILQQRKKSDDLDVEATVKQVSGTIDQIDEYYRDVRGAQRKGKSKVKWLEETLNELVDEKKTEERDKIIREIHEALSEANDRASQSILTHEQASVSRPVPDYTFEDINATIISGILDKEIQTVAGFSAILLADRLQPEPDDQDRELGVAKKYFEDELHSKIDSDIKKVVSVGTIIAREEGFIPALEGTSVPEIASMVDIALSTAKVAYKVAVGRLNPLEAMGRLYDRTTAVVCTLTRWKSKAVGWVAGTKIGAAIGTVFGPVGTAVGAVAGGVVGKVAGSRVGRAISRGVKKVARVAKTAVKKVWEGAKKAVSSFAKSKWNPVNWF